MFVATAVALGARVTLLAAEVVPTPLPLIAEMELEAAGTFLFHLS